MRRITPSPYVVLPGRNGNQPEECPAYLIDRTIDGMGWVSLLALLRRKDGTLLRLSARILPPHLEEVVNGLNLPQYWEILVEGVDPDLRQWIESLSWSERDCIFRSLGISREWFATELRLSNRVPDAMPRPDELFQPLASWLLYETSSIGWLTFLANRKQPYQIVGAPSYC